MVEGGGDPQGVRGAAVGDDDGAPTAADVGLNPYPGRGVGDREEALAGRVEEPDALLGVQLPSGQHPFAVGASEEREVFAGVLQLLQEPGGAVPGGDGQQPGREEVVVGAEAEDPFAGGVPGQRGGAAPLGVLAVPSAKFRIRRANRSEPLSSTVYAR